MVSPDWIIDSIDASVRLEEEKYHPSCLKTPTPVESEHRVSIDVCNSGIVLETPAQPQQCVDDVTSRLLDSKANGPPPDVINMTGEPSVAGGESSSHVARDLIANTGEGAQSANQMSAAERKDEGVTPDKASASKCEQLLDGVVIHFTDYQDCVEEDTMEKWELVSIGMLHTCIHTPLITDSLCGFDFRWSGNTVDKSWITMTPRDALIYLHCTRTVHCMPRYVIVKSMRLGV